MAACGSLGSDDMVMMDVCGVENQVKGEGTGEVGVVVQRRWAQPCLSDRQPTATAAQDTAAGWEPRSRQGSGLFTVD